MLVCTKSYVFNFCKAMLVKIRVELLYLCPDSNIYQVAFQATGSHQDPCHHPANKGMASPVGSVQLSP